MSSEPDRSNAHTSHNDGLRQEVEGLSVAVLAAKKALEDAAETFSTREEVADAKEEARKVRRRTVIAVLVSVALAMIGAFFVNNYAVTHCFFVKEPRPDALCNFMFQGYNDEVDKAVERLRQAADQAKENEAYIERNDARISELEAQVEQLKAAK